ncbi:hypothetical protein TNCV_3483351 [Trichonephila clavipes]|nr:hypothetical protein TNCV_3483351 [Trichonephila clavipes]
MNAKRPAENDNGDQQSQCEQKKLKIGQGCSRCFRLLTENYTYTYPGIFCPRCLEELRREYRGRYTCINLRAMTKRHG